jgi:NADH-quinone oxidoreductase subunit M
MMFAANSSVTDDLAFPILSAMILIPLVGAAIIALLPKTQEWTSKAIGLVVTSAVAGLGVWLMFAFDRGVAGYQAAESHTWIKDLGINYALGVDGISVFLVVLTSLLFPIAILISDSVKHNQRSFVAWLLVLQSASLVVFAARDLFLFFVGFELVLIPMYFLIAGFGHGEAKRVAVQILFVHHGRIDLLHGIDVRARRNVLSRSWAVEFRNRHIDAICIHTTFYYNGSMVVLRIRHRLRC